MRITVKAVHEYGEQPAKVYGGNYKKQNFDRWSSIDTKVKAEWCCDKLSNSKSVDYFVLCNDKKVFVGIEGADYDEWGEQINANEEINYCPFCGASIHVDIEVVKERKRVVELETVNKTVEMPVREMRIVEDRWEE